jgi:hypothetical protein
MEGVYESEFSAFLARRNFGVLLRGAQFTIVQFTSIQLGCPAKLISIRNNRNWNRNWFRNCPKQDVCFGCFGSISKQGVLVFRLNRNKKKTTERNRKKWRNSYNFNNLLNFFNIG